MPTTQILDITAPGFSFASPEVASAREADWYAQTPMGLLVLRYAEVQELMRDRRLIQSGKRYLEMHGVVDGPVYDWFVSAILHKYGEDHIRLRQLVNRTFKPNVIAALRPFMRATAERLAGQLDGVCDFVETFADKLPVAVMCRLLGMPVEDYDKVGRWSTDSGLIYSLAAGQEVLTRIESAVAGLHDYIDSLITRRAADPRDDLISALVRAQRGEEMTSVDELRNLVMSLIVAGHDTTRHQLGLALAAFCDHPDQWVLLGEHEELAEQAAHEVLRWSPSVPIVYRFAAEDVDYKGVHIAAGTFVGLCAHSAGRDPRAVRDGDRFDITVKRETEPLTFGAGPHYCLGAATARTEIAEALAVLTRRLGPPSIAGPTTWHSPTGIYGPETLPVRFG